MSSLRSLIKDGRFATDTTVTESEFEVERRMGYRLAGAAQ